MRIDLKDTAVVFRINVGILRDGSAFLECETIENVLGDVPHKNCLSMIARAAAVLAEKSIAFHEGHEGIRDETPQNMSDDDLVSFFDRVKEIDDTTL